MTFKCRRVARKYQSQESHRAFRRVGALAVLFATACGSQGSTTHQGGSPDATRWESESAAPEPDDSGPTTDTKTSDRSIESGALDASSFADVATLQDAATSNPPSDGATSIGDAGSLEAGVATIQGAGTFHCVCWADARDNRVNGLLQISGLDAGSDTYATVQAKARQILRQFREKLGANSIRIPINEPTVSNAWWNAYKAVIDTATADGMKVMVGYWAYRNGKPDDETAFKNMWQTVVSEYLNNQLVYFDIHNEPYGFGESWNDEAARWLGYFPSIPRGRVIVAGTRYNDRIPPVGADHRFDGCLLQLHLYPYWHRPFTTYEQWIDHMKMVLGDYAARTILGEWGAIMNDGANFDVSAAASNGNNEVAYMKAMSDFMHEAGMGSCYWPALKEGDWYSLMTLNTSGNTLSLSVVNASGVNSIRWAWNL